MKLSKIITQQVKAIKIPNIVDIKSVIIEHPKTSDKLSKIIKGWKDQAGAVKKSNSPLYSETKKWRFFGWKQNKKIQK